MNRFTLLAPLFLTAPLLIGGCVPVVAGGAAATGVTVAQERTFGDAIDDATIRSKINHRYLNSGTNNLYSDVEVQVTEGRVLLTGAVTSPDTAARAVQLAWEVQGVREVINEIQITNRGGPNVYTRDAWITTQAKSRLIAEKNVRSVNYNIETVNNVLYVMGIAQNENELARVLNVLSRVKGVRKVVSHVQLKNDPRRTPNYQSAPQAAPVETVNTPYDNSTYDAVPFPEPVYDDGSANETVSEPDNNYGGY